MYNAFTEIAYTEEQAISFLYECKDHLWRKDFLDVGGIDVVIRVVSLTETVNTKFSIINLCGKFKLRFRKSYECLETYTIQT